MTGIQFYSVTSMQGIHKGGCHCGEVAFEFDSPDSVTVYQCNCSICQMTDYLHLIVPASAFRLRHGTPSTYSFNSHVARHLFCSTCGIKSYYIPRSNPDGVSINFRCLDQSSFNQVKYQEFDGQNWEANSSLLAHLSRPEK